MRFLLALLLTFLGVIQFSLAQTKNPYVAAFDIAVKSFELQLRKIHEKSKDHNRESIKHLGQ